MPLARTARTARPGTAAVRPAEVTHHVITPPPPLAGGERDGLLKKAERGRAATPSVASAMWDRSVEITCSQHLRIISL